jgi:hypothetical protein
MPMIDNGYNCSVCYVDEYFKFSVHPNLFVVPNLPEINILFLRRFSFSGWVSHYITYVQYYEVVSVISGTGAAICTAVVVA